MVGSACRRSKLLSRREMRRPFESSLELASDFHPNLVVAPFSGRILFLEMIWAQDQIAGGEQNFLHFGILLDLGMHGRDNQFVVLTLLERPVFHPLSFEG